jgi:hypothetical protein
MSKDTEIKINDGEIQISHKGEQVVYWVSDEWEEDPSIVPAIANAIFLATTDIHRLIELVKLKR